MATRVSVIIPSYNSAHFLETSIQSVLRQTFDDFEIIVVDDGSTDNCEETAARFGNTIKYIRQDNRGLAGARNTGIQASRGDLISLLDADDEWHPDYLENMIALSERHTDAIVFYCMAQCMDTEGRDLPQFVGGPPVDQKALYHVLLRANFIIPSTVTFRKKAIAEAGSFDAGLRSCEDWDLWLRLLPGKKMIGVSKSLVRYRVHNSSLSTNLDGMHSAARRVIEKKFGIDDGNPAEWGLEKRRAYGGVYRYQCITYVQRQNNWDASLLMMKKALQIDPSLSMDVDFFYELILGTQPVGYRGVSKIQSFDEKSTRLLDLVSGSVDQVDRNIRKQTLGTANYALGLAAYNLGPRSLFRRYFAWAVVYRPELFFNFDLLGMYFKTFLSKEQLTKLKKVMDRHS